MRKNKKRNKTISLSEDHIQKLKKLCAESLRSDSNMIAFLIDQEYKKEKDS